MTLDGLHDRFANYKLCYIDNDEAYFTSHKNLDDQCGDNWNDPGYYENAGIPYSKNGSELVRIYFWNQWGIPDSHYKNRPSVEDINRKEFPWICKIENGDSFILWAGERLEDFIKKVEEEGSTVQSVGLFPISFP